MKKCNIILGDALETLKTMPDESVQCIVTSPPYWGLRDYGIPGQLGLEQTLPEFIKGMVLVFREANRVLKRDGTLWLNMGDSYAVSGGSGKQGKNGQRADRRHTQENLRQPTGGIKPKDMCGVPWRLAFALQDDGWYLRQDIIWHKPNPMPESTRDRCTKAHEYLFLMTKSRRYLYNFEAMQERVSGTANARTSQKMPDGWNTGAGAHGSFHPQGREKGRNTGVGWGHGSDKDKRSRERVMGRKDAEREEYVKANKDWWQAHEGLTETRNKRSVWTIGSEAFKGAHFATFPRALVMPCILAGTRPGDMVLDPFNGSGTTGQVALELGRYYTGIEINPEYVALTEKRLDGITYGLGI